jgi:hypothetical protein
VALAQVMSEARTTGPDDPVIALVNDLTDGHTHAVVVTADDRRVLGIITQTDLLATLTRLLSVRSFTSAITGSSGPVVLASDITCASATSPCSVSSRRPIVPASRPTHSCAHGGI